MHCRVHAKSLKQVTGYPSSVIDLRISPNPFGWSHWPDRFLFLSAVPLKSTIKTETSFCCECKEPLNQWSNSTGHFDGLPAKGIEGLLDGSTTISDLTWNTSHCDKKNFSSFHIIWYGKLCILKNTKYNNNLLHGEMKNFLKMYIP